MKNSPLITVLLVIIFSGIGFFAGTKYQQSKVPSFAVGSGNFRQMGGNTAAGGAIRGQAGNTVGQRRMGAGQVLGSITSKDDKSITVQLQDGSSKIILLSTNTTFDKSTSAASTDLKTGDKVAVFGTTNTDGSVSAASVQINPTFRAMGNPSVSPAPAK